MSRGVPFYYDYINHQESSYAPNKIKVYNTGVFNYFQRMLLQDAISVTKWKLPKEWNKNYFLYGLYCWGYMAVFETDKYGVIPQGCGLKGYNVMYQPTHAVISNPLLRGILTPQIGSECTLIKLMPDYGSIMPIVRIYAEQMAIAYDAFISNLFNSKFSWVFISQNKAAAEGLKKMYDMISAGDPAVFIDRNMRDKMGNPNWEQFNNNVGGNFIADELQTVMRKIKNEFDTAIGIPSANTEKKERQIVDEVNANNVETYSKPALWLECLQEGCEQTRELFGIDISVELRTVDTAGPNNKEQPGGGRNENGVYDPKRDSKLQR